MTGSTGEQLTTDAQVVVVSHHGRPLAAGHHQGVGTAPLELALHAQVVPRPDGGGPARLTRGPAAVPVPVPVRRTPSRRRLRLERCPTRRPALVGRRALGPRPVRGLPFPGEVGQRPLVLCGPPVSALWSVCRGPLSDAGPRADRRVCVGRSLVSKRDRHNGNKETVSACTGRETVSE